MSRQKSKIKKKKTKKKQHPPADISLQRPLAHLNWNFSLSSFLNSVRYNFHLRFAGHRICQSTEHSVSPIFFSLKRNLFFFFFFNHECHRTCFCGRVVESGTTCIHFDFWARTGGESQNGMHVKESIEKVRFNGINCGFYKNRRNSGLVLYLKMLSLVTWLEGKRVRLS